MKKKKKKKGGQGRRRQPRVGGSAELLRRQNADLRSMLEERDAALSAIREQIGPYLSSSEAVVSDLEAAIAENQALKSTSVKITPCPSSELVGHPFDMMSEMGITVRRQDIGNLDGTVIFMEAPENIGDDSIKALDAMISSFSERIGVPILPILVTGNRGDRALSSPVICRLSPVDKEPLTDHEVALDDVTSSEVSREETNALLDELKNGLDDS